jgi:hypothetical protein
MAAFLPLLPVNNKGGRGEYTLREGEKIRDQNQLHKISLLFRGTDQDSRCAAGIRYAQAGTHNWD